MNHKHGHAAGNGSPTYKSWSGMIHRVRHHPEYIARGIGCCARWASFENFLADMGERLPGTSIERVDNDKGYEPGNCRWGTRTDQSRNRRGRRWVLFRGKRMLLSVAVEQSGVSKAVFEQRVYKRGWGVARALTTPVREYRR